MTKEEIDQLQSCEATNVLLAEKVMLSKKPTKYPAKGKGVTQSPSGAWFYSLSTSWNVQNFSGDIDAAMMIAEKIYERFEHFSELCGLHLIQLEKNLWAASFSITADDLWYESEHINSSLAAALGETAPLAIARAALKAVRNPAA
jgi:hypothetical protein